jgi:beta-glucosidase
VNGIANYSEGVFVGYRHFDSKGIPPLFPFGHGLSYSTFAYGNLTVSPVRTGEVSLAFTVTNTGAVAGGEVAQVYVGMPSNAVPQPPKQLKAFSKVFLEPGESAELLLTLDSRAFSYWDVASHGWKVALGTYQIMVGSSSRDIRLQGQVSF